MTSQTALRSAPDLPSMLNLDVAQIAKALQSHELTSVDLVQTYLARIDEARDFRAVLETNPDALSIARELDEERLRTGPRSVLHGIPILVKDNIVTQDKLEASAGSFALLGSKPVNESSIIHKLREAGVIILGKTNLSEWANFRGWDTHSGWSPRGGQNLGTRGPKASPGGSSSGSAVAAALALSTAALGTETVGSIIEPAEFNGVVGLKPTRGLVANDGVVPISVRQDVVGTLTRSVLDAAYLLSTMAGRSDHDKWTWNIPIEPIPDFTQFCQSTDLSGVAIGVPRNSFDSDPALPSITAFESALKLLEQNGAKIVDKADFPDLASYEKLTNADKNILRSSDFLQDISNYLGSLSTNPNNLHNADDIVEFTKTNKDEDYPKRDVKNFADTQEHGISVDSDEYKSILERELQVASKGTIMGALEKYGVDVLITPYGVGTAVVLSAMLGSPAITVPLGFYPEGTPLQTDSGWPNLIKVGPGMPYGISIIGKPFADGLVLKVAHAFEQLTNVIKEGPCPHKLPKVELKDRL